MCEALPCTLFLATVQVTLVGSAWGREGGGEGGLSRQEWTPPMGREGEGTDDTQNVATAVHYDTFGLHSSCVFWL